VLLYVNVQPSVIIVVAAVRLLVVISDIAVHWS